MEWPLLRKATSPFGKIQQEKTSFGNADDKCARHVPTTKTSSWQEWRCQLHKSRAQSTRHVLKKNVRVEAPNPMTWCTSQSTRSRFRGLRRVAKTKRPWPLGSATVHTHKAAMSCEFSKNCTGYASAEPRILPSPGRSARKKPQQSSGQWALVWPKTSVSEHFARHRCSSRLLILHDGCAGLFLVKRKKKKKKDDVICGRIGSKAKVQRTGKIVAAANMHGHQNIVVVTHNPSRAKLSVQVHCRHLHQVLGRLVQPAQSLKP